MYTETTDGIEVTVMPVFIDERSNPAENEYFWAYRVRIVNRSKHTVQLINRYWNITDGNGKTEEVHGAGVVGEQPILEPDGAFEYTSGCPLSTSSGIMLGHYEMKAEDGRRLLVRIPAFSLDHPDDVPNLN